ncbi:restriction endonuclease [Geobacter sp. SVR]|uniref:restriction endonuclease n=1 Tax=Geobacter sp. SVR TaxID=2495594 RepID=UPI00143EF5FF|nr:restriction endonuclease [Geobacter sp. SVR]BCS51812.1 type II restriction endonuclease zinc finger [Geobacter sp. SVR]GCF87001.1 type II restriction endonuclease zinc finger [Geobacter sp. SVR]
MARKKSSPVEDLVIVISKLPWWIGVALALVSYVVLHSMASRPMLPTAATPGQMGDAAVRSITTTLAMFGQYVLPFAFGLGAVLSAVAAARQKKLYDTTASRPGVGALNDMSWQEFEMLVSEHYRRKGFQVIREGGNGPDGGIDLVLRQKDEIYLVQCKQWKAYKVGVQPVREFYGVMASRGAAGGYFVTSGEYTADAKSFAQGCNVELIDGQKLRLMINAARTKSAIAPQSITPPQAASTPACPKCGKEMVRRVARQGSNAGKEFWGCSSFPKCKAVFPLEGTH